MPIRVEGHRRFARINSRVAPINAEALAMRNAIASEFAPNTPLNLIAVFCGARRGYHRRPASEVLAGWFRLSESAPNESQFKTAPAVAFALRTPMSPNRRGV